MKRMTVFFIITCMAVILACCGKNNKADGNSSGKEESAEDTSFSESGNADESKADESSRPEDTSISTENVPAVVLSDFEKAALAVKELTGGDFTEEDVCYETYKYSDEYGTWQWDGQGLDIALSSNPTTGYFWTIEQFGEKNSFSVTEDEYIQGETEADGEPLVGVGGVQHYYLTPNTRGGDAFVLDYSRQNSDGTREPGAVYLLCAHADEGDEITFSIRRFTTSEQ